MNKIPNATDIPRGCPQMFSSARHAAPGPARVKRASGSASRSSLVTFEPPPTSSFPHLPTCTASLTGPPPRACHQQTLVRKLENDLCARPGSAHHPQGLCLLYICIYFLIYIYIYIYIYVYINSGARGWISTGETTASARPRFVGDFFGGGAHTHTQTQT